MSINTVAGLGFVIEADRAGMGYKCHTWVRGTASPESEKHSYGQLSLTELVDLITTMIDDARPGTQLGAGWRVVPLEL